MTNGDVVGGSSQASDSTPKGKRSLSDLIDLLAMPIILGIVAGLILIAVPEGIRNLILIAINIGWLLFRDRVYSPGRKLFGLKLISLDGHPVSLRQAFVRNVLLMVPYLLVIGYIVEIVFVFWKGNRLADGWAHTRVVTA